MPFSQPHADAACNFFELVLKHTADEWYGKPFLLMPWEDEALSQTFGLIDHDSNRIIEMVYLEVPKKSGKTEFAAGIVLLVLVSTNMPGCQVYGAAASTRQAMNVYRAACKMVEQSPILSKRLRVLRGTNRILKRNDPDSFYAAIAGDGDLGDGVNPACVVADEVHRWKTRKQLENWDVLSNGGITRRQTLTIGITTAGVQNESPIAWRLHEKTRKIQEGIVSDPKFYGRIYGASAEDDPADEKTWIKASPSLQENGGFLPIEKLRERYEALKAEGDLTSWKRYFLNLWDQKENRAIDMQQWDACPKRWKAAGLLPKPPEDLVRPLPHELLKHFIDRKCFAGIDTSMTTDLSSLVFLFPCDEILCPSCYVIGQVAKRKPKEGAARPELDEIAMYPYQCNSCRETFPESVERNDPPGGFDLLPFFWTPESTLRQRQVKDGMPYQKWADEGFLELSQGNVIDTRDIRARLEWGARLFDLEEMCFDPWNTREMSVKMVEDGFPCVEVRQGFASLSEASKKLLELVAGGKLYHGGHPLLRFNASCVSAKESNDNLIFEKPERHTSSSRIDGISATVTGMSRALVAESKTITYTGLRSVG